MNLSTAEKIKAAARTVFHKKGYAGTRTRDIAEEAGINLALLNYYFRSKEKLFGIIITETMKAFFQNLTVILNDENSSLELKVEQIASSYIDLISREPAIPTFIISEIRNNPAGLLEKLPFKKLLTQSVFLKQFNTAVQEGRIIEPSPIHFLMNLIGLIVFPFIAKPLLKAIGDLDETQFQNLMQQRKKLIPQWISDMTKA